MCIRPGTRIEGTIDAINRTEQQLVIGDVTVRITDGTIIRQAGQVVTFADLEVGQTIAACGVLEGDLLAAARVTVMYRGS